MAVKLWHACRGNPSGREASDSDVGYRLNVADFIDIAKDAE